MPRLFNLPRFAAASAVVLAAASGAVSSFAQEPPAPAAPPVPVAPAPPAALSEPDKTQTEADKKQFADAVKAFGQAQKAYSEADRKRMAEWITALQNKNMAVRSYGYATNSLGGGLPSKTISVDLKNVSARDALVKVLNEAKLDYVLDDDFPQNAKLTLSISGVQISTALDLITESAGVRWAAEKRDGKRLVRVGKKVAANPFSIAYASSNAISNLFGGAAQRGTPAPFLRWNGVQLPPAKISITVTDALTRDTLVSLLEKQKLAYEIADDFPKDAKISLAIENSDLPSVLDSITRSVGFRWVADKRDDKIVVRVGKNVMPDSFYYLYGGKDGKSGSSLPVPVDGERVNRIRVDKSASGTPVIYQYQTTEQRSTFTCPRCGKKTTVVQKSTSTSGTDAKADVKTARHDDWHYCPYCGKKVADQTTNHALPVWDDGDAVDGTGANEMPAPFFPNVPVFDTSFSDDPALFERH